MQLSNNCHCQNEAIPRIIVIERQGLSVCLVFVLCIFRLRIDWNCKFDRIKKCIMSKKRNNVNYIKPADPKFLQQLKAQIGYQTGPTIDTKVIDDTFINFFPTHKTANLFSILSTENGSVKNSTTKVIVALISTRKHHKLLFWKEAIWQPKKQKRSKNGLKKVSVNIQENHHKNVFICWHCPNQNDQNQIHWANGYWTNDQRLLPHITPMSEPTEKNYRFQPFVDFLFSHFRWGVANTHRLWQLFRSFVIYTHMNTVLCVMCPKSQYRVDSVRACI